MSARPLLALAIAATLLAPAAAAHAERAWILPSFTVLSGRDPWVAVDAAVSSELFHPEHSAIRLESLAVTAPDGSPGKLENALQSKYRTTFDLHLDRPGTWKVSSASEGLFAQWKENGEPRRRRFPDAASVAIPPGATDVKLTETSQRNETFVTAGAPTRDVLKPTGRGLELEAVTHPNDVLVGEPAGFRLLLDGAPAPGATVLVAPGAARFRATLGEMELKTDAQGRFTLRLPEAGMWWISSTVEGGPGKAPNSTRRASYSAVIEAQRP